MELRYGRGYVYALKYHLIWCTKYRKDVLVGDIKADVKSFLLRVAPEHGVTIEAMEAASDHIHLLIETKPQSVIPSFVKAFKGGSARHVFRRHPWLAGTLYRGHLWNPSYYIATVGEQAEDAVKKYVEGQKKK
jgi:putative transposase